MLIESDRLKYYLTQAKTEKDDIKTIYNDVLELTDPFIKIEDAGKIKLSDMRDIDSTVVDAIDAYRSFIMSSILPRSGQWAGIEIDEKRIIDEMGEGAQGDIDEVKAILDDNVKKVFNYIQASNYYKEISKAVESFIKVGVGAFSIRETGSTAKPFVFNYMGLNNLYFLEDSLSRPTIVFKLHPEVNGTYLMDIFGSDVKMPDGLSEDNPESTVNVFEIQIPEYDEQTTLTNYNYMILTEDLGTLIKEKVLPYAPLIVHRYDVLEGNSWGKSTVVGLKNLLVELNAYKELYNKQARRIANPPAVFAGNMELFDSLSLEEGTISYVGDPMREGAQGQFQAINTNIQLMPLDKLITEQRQLFRQALMVDDLIGANMNDGKGITASYVNMRQELFRKRFANTYELINSELLEPTFMACLRIMMNYNMLGITEDLIPYTSLQYMNALSKANNSTDVNALLNYSQIIAQLNQANGQLGVAMNLPKATSWVAQKLDINLELIPTESELTEIQEAQRQQAIQQQQMAQMGGAPDEANNQQ